MFKKLLIASIILAASNSAFAMKSYKGDYKAEAMPCPAWMAAPYIGLSVGPRVVITGAPSAYTGLEGTLSAGYGALLSPAFYLAGEIFVGDSANLKDFKTVGATGTLVGPRTSWSYGLDIIPGYLITNDVLGYLRAGVVRTRFSDIGTNKTGWQVGIGGQTTFMPNWDLRGEYVYSQYNRTTQLGRPLSHQFNLGVVYKFI